MAHTVRPPVPGRRRWLAAGAAAALALTTLAAGPGSAGADPHHPATYVDPEIHAELAASGTTEFFVYLTETADLSGADQLTTRANRTEHVYQQLSTTAQTSQAGLRATLDARGVEYTPYWAVNTILVTGDRTLLDTLASRPDVARIEPNRELELLGDPGTDHAGTGELAAAAPDPIEWNIRAIHAPKVWEAFGSAGDKMVVASIDTGVQYTHPALRKQYRGGAHRQPRLQLVRPCRDLPLTGTM